MMDLVRKMTMAGLAFAALAVAYNLQAQWGLEPCTMCIVQRYAFMVIYIGAVGHYILHEGFRPVWPYTSAAAIVVGLLASARIQWAISVPSVTCGRDKIAVALNGLPWVDSWPAMFEATGVCGDKVAPVLGLPFHAWSALLFVVMGVLLWLGRAARKRLADVKS